MALKCCIVLEQNDTMFKQCWLFTANTQPYLILQEWAVIWAIDCRRSSMSPFQLKNMTSMTFRATWVCRAIFFPGVFWATHSAFCCFNQKSNEYINDTSTVKTRARNAFISSLLQIGDTKENTHGSVVITEHMWIPLCTNFSFPHATADDMVNICCQDSDFCSRSWNTARAVKDRCHLFHLAFIRRRWWGSTARGIDCLFAAILNDTHASVNSFLWRSMWPYTFLQWLVTI